MAIGALTSALFFTGSATITRGTTEQLVVQSNPSGANVRLDTGQTGITPASFTVPRKRDIVLTVSKEGYQTVSQTDTTKIAGRGAAGLAGNALIGGIIGIGVDAVSGASLNHTPNPVVLNLVANEAVAATPTTAEQAHPADAAVKPAQPASAEKAAEPVKAPAPPPAAEKTGAKTDGK